MITEREWKRIEKKASSLYSTFELELIRMIAERVIEVGEANTIVFNNLVILQKMGVLLQDIVELVAEYNEQNKAEILALFNDVEMRSIYRDDKIYKAMGFNPMDISDEYMRLIEASALRTNFNIDRLTGTIASEGQLEFLNILNRAYLETTTGAKSYTQAMVDGLREIGRIGARVQYPSGVTRSLESAIRTNIITSINQTSASLQIMRAREMGIDKFEVSAHYGARPSHAEWQGRVYSYRGLVDICGYGNVEGLCGANCRHTFFPYYDGDQMAYTRKELYDMSNSFTKYNGEKISEYEASQIQRKMERKIRENEKQIASLKVGVDSFENNEEYKQALKLEREKKRKNTNELNDLLEQTGLKKDNTRLII